MAPAESGSPFKICGLVTAVFKRLLGGTEAPRSVTAARMLRHRSPTAAGTGVVADARAVLAFQSLSVIDLTGGDRRMADSGHDIVFNGDLYKLPGDLEGTR